MVQYVVPVIIGELVVWTGEAVVGRAVPILSDAGFDKDVLTPMVRWPSQNYDKLGVIKLIMGGQERGKKVTISSTISRPSAHPIPPYQFPNMNSREETA